jgi:signal peptidase I
MRHANLFGAVIEEALTTGTMVRFHAAGTSMYPSIRDGEIITVSGVSTDEVVPGDVLLCRHEKRVLAHRVVAVTMRGPDRFFDLRGDAKVGCDEPVAADAVVGKVVGVRRNGRLVPLCGRAARLRYRARAVASRAKSYIASKATILFGTVSPGRSRRAAKGDGFRVSSRPGS